MDYLKAFLVGGLICVIGQILIDKTKLTPASILTGCVVLGVFAGALGVYKPLVDFAGAGATVPLCGFGYNLYKGVKTAIAESGWLGILTGGLTACSGGIAAAIIFGLLAGAFGKPKDKD
jgi:stage V sporulation protein AE